jgi:hypothetical protein
MRFVAGEFASVCGYLIVIENLFIFFCVLGWQLAGQVN